MGTVHLERRTRVPWIDALRVTAAILVVLNHVSVPLFYRFGGERRPWLAGVVAHGVSASCVHLFFLVAGALAFRRSPSFELAGLSARLLRLGLPLVFYSAIYAFFFRVVDGTPLRSPLTYLVEPAAYHLWFFAPMLLMALLGAALQPGPPSRAGIAVTTALLLLNAHAFTPFGLSGAADSDIGMLGNVNAIGPVLSFFLLSVLGHHLAALPKSGWVSIVAAVVTVGTTALMIGGIVETSTDHLAYSYLDDVGLPCLGQGVGIFVLFMRLDDVLSAHPRWSALLSTLASRSLGVYGLHLLTIELFRRYASTDAWLFEAPWHLVVLTAVVAVVTWGLAWLLSRVDRRHVLG